MTFFFLDPDLYIRAFGGLGFDHAVIVGDHFSDVFQFVPLDDELELLFRRQYSET